MAATVLTIDAISPQTRHIERCVAVLEAGGIIAYPTDTYYGIGCDLSNEQAVDRIYRLKARSRNQPLSFVCADPAEVKRYANVSDAAFALLRRLTPGPYTFVLNAGDGAPRVAITQQKTVGVRVPDSPIALALVQALGRPLASTSASTPEGAILVDPDDILESLGDGLDLIIDCGCQLDEPSTVLDLTGDEPVVLRKGKGDVLGLA